MRSYVDANMIQQWSWDLDVLGDAPVQYQIAPTGDGDWTWTVVKCGPNPINKIGLAETESLAVNLAEEWIDRTWPNRQKVRIQ